MQRIPRMGRPSLVWMHLLVLLIWVGTACGLENVRNVDWVYQPQIEWAPEDSPVSVAFDADLTALEIRYAITSFSVALVYPEGTPVILNRYSVGPLPAATPAGTPAHFGVQLSIRCDPLHGDVEVRHVAASMRYVDPTIGEADGSVKVEMRNAHGSVQKSLGIAILDQDGNIVSQSLPSDTFTCNGENPATEFNGALGVYFDPEGQFCQGTIPAGTVGKVYILATLGGATASGLAGAEFRFDGVPTAWEAYAVPSPDLLALGNPFGDGVVAGFPCKSSNGDKVLLYTVVIIAHEDVTDVRFNVEMRNPPLNFECPLVVACDEPEFTKYCVETSACFVNATSRTPCATPLAIEEVTWSAMKELYR